MQIKKLLDINQVAEITHLKLSTLYHYVCTRKIPHIKIGTRTLFDSEDINEWLKEKKVKPITQD